MALFPPWCPQGCWVHLRFLNSGSNYYLCCWSGRGFNPGLWGHRSTWSRFQSSTAAWSQDRDTCRSRALAVIWPRERAVASSSCFCRLPQGHSTRVTPSPTRCRNARQEARRPSLSRPNTTWVICVGRGQGRRGRVVQDKSWDRSDPLTPTLFRLWLAGVWAEPPFPNLLGSLAGTAVGGLGPLSLPLAGVPGSFQPPPLLRAQGGGSFREMAGCSGLGKGKW